MPDKVNIQLPNDWVLMDCPANISKVQLVMRLFRLAPQVFVACMERDETFADCLLREDDGTARTDVSVADQMPILPNTIPYSFLPERPLNFDLKGSCDA